MEIKGRFNQMGVALLRIAVGVIFLWAGLEKYLAPKPFDAGGFLKFGSLGTLGWPFVTGEVAQGTVFNPTHDFWVGLAANASLMSVINTLVVFGEIGIGVALILGLFTRFAAAAGTVMMILFFFAAWDFEFGIVNQHLTYALICATICGLGAGRYYGLDGALATRVAPAIRRYLMSGEPVPVAA